MPLQSREGGRFRGFGGGVRSGLFRPDFVRNQNAHTMKYWIIRFVEVFRQQLMIRTYSIMKTW